MSATDEPNQPPRKRTGVWSSDSTKQKTSDNVLKRFLKTDVKRLGSFEEDDDTSTAAKDKISVVPLVGDQSVKSDLLKMPALHSWVTELNMSLLLRKFNSPDEVKESDTPWSEDLLFAEITSKLSEDQSSDR